MGPTPQEPLGLWVALKHGPVSARHRRQTVAPDCRKGVTAVGACGPLCVVVGALGNGVDAGCFRACEQHVHNQWAVEKTWGLWFGETQAVSTNEIMLHEQVCATVQKRYTEGRVSSKGGGGHVL